ncbi:hypothetical protein GV054_18805 [Marinomonas mediterranea]|jgi:hypothetical protein|uniref:Uncharacterized protein n=1 Tax=Marinomonas mediterranea (strain ATCC 700492 / JCM 21426 / NBRC 103028 / MMB-1) TaxID=717774 RepID=F2JW43_MARM1|nr:hypothetical protein [Marinomonas mediterranea]ADZ92931.1 hypothetical protein Marme_3721 [Marinomonas mediterranea MMB-1]WCN14910.1 hypothetical protein GV054_18805 [Marinomonas mediterranea]WCN18954.1 hypothetical protein GV053_18860 [Marinomonas mediterranea MMB-1]
MKQRLKFIDYVSQPFSNAPLTQAQWRLLFLLQVSIWWLPFSSLLEDVNKREREIAQYDLKQMRDQRQGLALDRWQAPEGSHVELEVHKTAQNDISLITLEGSLDLLQWESLFESLQSIASLSVTGMNWRRESDRWHAILELAVLPPQSNRSFINWLPIDSRINSFSEVPAIQLISTLTKKNEHWVKVEHFGKQFWVKNGDWIPMIQATLMAQQQRSATFVRENGVPWTVSLTRRVSVEQ